jgi:hypothetical protein
MALTTSLFTKSNDPATPRRRRPGRRSMRPLAAAIEALEPRRLMTAITGIVYADTNGNGTQDSGESGVPGIEVTYDSANNTSTASDGTFTVSGAAGSGTHYAGGGSYVNTGSDASLSFGIEFTPGLNADAPSASEVDLSWSNGDSSLRAVIQRSSDEGSTWTTLTSTPLSSGTTTYADTDPALSPGATYEYSLTMVDSSGNPIASATAAATTMYSTLTTVHDRTLTISTDTLGSMGAIPWSLWNSASMQTGTTAQGGSVTANDDGTWTYTPPSGWVGNDTLMYTLSNDTTTSSPVPITVAVTDQAPQAGDVWIETVNSNPTDPDNAAPPISAPGGAWEGLGATDGDGDTLTYHLVNADGSAATEDGSGNVSTEHGEVSLSSDGTYTYTYTPAEGFVGVDRFYYVANDGLENSNVATVTVNVNGGIPVLTVPDVYDSAGIGEPFTFSLDGGAYQNVDLSQLEILSQPANGTVSLNSDGDFVYTAAGNGLTSFTFGMGPDVPPSTILINVNTDYSFTWGGVGGTIYSVNHGDTLDEEAAGGLLTGVEYPPGGTLSVNLLSGPTSGTLTLGTNIDDVQDGSFSYTPGDTTGWVYISYDVQSSDGATSPPATAAIYVSDNLPITYQAASFVSTAPGTPLNLDPRTSFVSAETPLDTLTTSIPSGLGPQHGSLTVNDDGTLTYTPTAGFTGIDSFTYQVSDGVTDASFGSISQTDSLNSGYCTIYIDVASS